MPVRPPDRAMRVSRVILGLLPVCLVAVSSIGCAVGTGIHPRVESGESALRISKWPVAGKVASGFGGRGGSHHGGIDILAPEGTDVLAALAGRVVSAGDTMRGYGNTVVLDHGEGVTTLYGHLREIHVKSADTVSEGKVIGSVGRTGNATTSHLHFEIRFGGRTVDPLNYLPRVGETR